MQAKKYYSTFALKPTVMHVREDAPTLVTPPVIDPIALQAAVDLAVAGLKAKNVELLGKLKDGQTKLDSYGNLDPVRAKTMMEQMDNDEDVKLFSEGKKNVVIDKYTERMRTSHSAEMETERGNTQAERTRADAYRGAVLDNQIRAVTSECHKGAVEDALLLGRQPGWVRRLALRRKPLV